MTTPDGDRPSPGSGPAIEAAGLVKRYPNDVLALDGLEFDVEAGTIFGLVGPNGAGKSTALKILTTLCRPDDGTARVGGYDVLRQPHEVRLAIGVVAQGSAVDREATGRENLELQGRLYGLSGRELDDRTSALLDRFGLADAADRVARGYSGGMQRRLDVAMGLVHRPRILFLDEPTTGLDPEVRVDMWGEILRLADDEGLTILLTTHYLEEADRLAKRIAIMDGGRVVVAGTPDDLKDELLGDALRLELDRREVEEERVRSALARLEGVSEVVLRGRTVHARVDQGARAVPAALAALESAGLPVAAITMARPSLEDVYLRYAGRSFSQADTEDAEDAR